MASAFRRGMKRNDLTNATLVDATFQRAAEGGGVAKNETKDQFTLMRPCQTAKLLHLLGRLSRGLFEKNVVTTSKGGGSLTEVVCVLRRNDGEIRETLLKKTFLTGSVGSQRSG
jgi:hypothetical protein